ncbi:hypothetical protein COCNU_13G007890 [Cocos nucifera]|uniref:Uncharacterized protein n=1 Tax=Cocos nucifera TaxID=13894 RepID=A0A8K0IV51_COCNU|nr:hypothetical protein COCNU_13G007890 [Cocos nucifera]
MLASRWYELLRDSVTQVPKLEEKDLSRYATLKEYKIPPLKELLSEQALFNAGLSSVEPKVMILEELAALRWGANKRKAPPPTTEASKRLKTMEEIQKKATAPSPCQLGVIFVSLIRSSPLELDSPSILQADFVPTGPDSLGESIEWKQSSKVDKESKDKQQKRLITSLIRMGHYAAVVINQIMEVEKEMVALQSKYEKAEASNTEAKAKFAKARAEVVAAKSKAEVAETEVNHLMKALEEAEALKAKVAEAGKEAVAAFRASKEFSLEKINFGQEDYIVGRDICRQRVAMHFSELDLSFLDREYDGGVGGDLTGDKARLEVQASSVEKMPAEELLEHLPKALPLKDRLIKVEEDLLQAEGNVIEAQRKLWEMEKNRKKASFEIKSLTKQVERIDKEYVAEKINWDKEHRKWDEERSNLLKSIADKKWELASVSTVIKEELRKK